MGNMLKCKDTNILLTYYRLTEVPKEAFWIPSENLVKGILPGAQLDVFYPGFPTLKHIKHRVSVSKSLLGSILDPIGTLIEGFSTRGTTILLVTRFSKNMKHKFEILA